MLIHHVVVENTISSLKSELFLCLDPQYKLQHVDVIVTERQLLSSSPETNVFRRNFKQMYLGFQGMKIMLE